MDKRMFLRKRKPEQILMRDRHKEKLAKHQRILNNSFYPVMHQFVTFLTVDEFIPLSLCNHFLNHFMKQPLVWRNLHQAHYHLPFQPSNFKPQYIAETLYQQTQSAHLTPERAREYYLKLHKHIKQFETETWTLFYFTYLSSLDDEYTDPFEMLWGINYYGFRCLETNLRVAPILLNYYYSEFSQIPELVDVNDLAKLLLALSTYPQELTCKLMAKLYALLYAQTSTAEVITREDYKNKAINAYYQTVNLDQNDLKEFTDEFNLLFMTLQMLSSKQQLRTKPDVKQSVLEWIVDKQYFQGFTNLHRIMLRLFEFKVTQGHLKLLYHCAESLQFYAIALIIKPDQETNTKIATIDHSIQTAANY
jgi:hypothetical protein